MKEHRFLFLENTKSQEFKWLSSFSSADDIEIIRGMNEFVDSYGDWIEIKRQVMLGWG